MMLGFMTFIVGLQADCIANNRKLLEDIQYRIRRLDYREDEREREASDKDAGDQTESADHEGTGKITKQRNEL